MLVILVLTLTTALQQARAQTLNCSTIPRASEYGTDLSVCQMPDQSSLRCTQDNGGLSYCQVEHANGFVSSTGQNWGAGQALGMLIAWMIHTHRQHVTDRAISDASSTVLLTMKHTMHLMDMSTLLDRLGPYLPPDQKESFAKMSKGLAEQSSAFSGGVSNFSANWNEADPSSFLREAKNLHKLYDSGLIAVCTARSASQLLTGKLDTVRANLAANVVEGLNAVRGDEMLLAPECDSKRATTLLQKQHQQTSK